MTMRATSVPLQSPGVQGQSRLVTPPVDDAFILLRETHHRLMNTFTLVARQLRLECAVVDPAGRPALMRAEHLMVARSELHRWLALGAKAREVQIGDYVAELCWRLSAAILEPLNLRCEAVVEDGMIPGADCERLGLMVCELVLNAAKHAFPLGAPGCLRVVLMRQAEGWSCTVADNGRGGFQTWPPPRLGQALVDALGRDLGATVTTCSSSSGTTVVILFPAVGEARSRRKARDCHSKL